MAKYSVELKDIIKSGFNLGMKEYPLFSEEYRNKLNDKILKHYYFYEIGFETAEKFKFYLNQTMEEIMPYYNKLYQSELLTINPLLSFERKSNTNKNIDTTANKTTDNQLTQTQVMATNATNTTAGTDNQTQHNESVSEQDTTNGTIKTNSGTKDSTNKDYFSETPNNAISEEDLQLPKYLTNARLISDNSNIDETEHLDISENINKSDTSTLTTTNVNTLNSTTNSTNNATNNSQNDIAENETSNVIETNVITENGFEIPLADLLLKYRETFLNIDMLIIDELKDLFMMIY